MRSRALVALLLLRACALAASHCYSLTSSESVFPVRAQHCEETSHSGHFVLSVHEALANARFRGRVVGTVIRELRLTQRGTLVTGRYSLPSGNYTASVDLRYLEFDPENFNETRPFYTRNEIFRHQFVLPSRVCPRAVTQLRGHWSSSKYARVEVLPVTFMAGAQMSVELLLDSLRYELESCRLMSDAAIENCVRGGVPYAAPLQLCLFGDSQTRHLSNALITLMQADQSFFSASSNKTDKSRIASSFIHDVDDWWGDCFVCPPAACDGCVADLCRPEAAQVPPCNLTVVERCSAVLFNFGQWQVAPPEGHGDPWPVSRYAAAVDRALRNARLMLPEKRLIWVTLHPHGETDPMYTKPPTDWRTDIVLGAYNDAALKACEAHNFEFIDIFNVANAVHDLTYDGAHYKAPVARELARLVYHSVCATE